jgi:two-component system response regulator ResD
MATVLVVDDDDAIRRLIRLVLVRLGLVVREARNGSEAIEALTEEEFDVVVLDLMMPVVSGFDVLDYMKTLDGRNSRVVVISAAAETRIQQLDSSVIQAIVRKPFDINQLAKTILACIPRRENGDPTADSSVDGTLP